MSAVDEKSGLNAEELQVMEALVSAWNIFVLLPQTDRDDLDDFRRSIHEAQRILANRVVSREHSEYWR